MTRWERRVSGKQAVGARLKRCTAYRPCVHPMYTVYTDIPHMPLYRILCTSCVHRIYRYAAYRYTAYTDIPHPVYIAWRHGAGRMAMGRRCALAELLTWHTGSTWHNLSNRLRCVVLRLHRQTASELQQISHWQREQITATAPKHGKVLAG